MFKHKPINRVDFLKMFDYIPTKKLSIRSLDTSVSIVSNCKEVYDYVEKVRAHVLKGAK
jgi:hypothetical protein